MFRLVLVVLSGKAKLFGNLSSTRKTYLAYIKNVSIYVTNNRARRMESLPVVCLKVIVHTMKKVFVCMMKKLLLVCCTSHYCTCGPNLFLGASNFFVFAPIASSAVNPEVKEVVNYTVSSSPHSF